MLWATKRGARGAGRVDANLVFLVARAPILFLALLPPLLLQRPLRLLPKVQHKTGQLSQLRMRSPQ